MHHSPIPLARMALLIDADNIAPVHADQLFAEIDKRGTADVRRIYGDFSDGRLKQWQDVVNSHALVPQQVFAAACNKNAADIAMVIDAMDLLATGRFNAFCIVSSDSDFSRLATRIREQGLAVYGFGEKKTTPAFRNTCTEFIELLQIAKTKRLGEIAAPPAAAPRQAQSPHEKPEALLRQALQELSPTNGWFLLGSVGLQMRKLDAGFTAKRYNYRTLTQLAEATGVFEIRSTNKGSQIRPKAAATS